jgi:hypothetical protein
MQRPYSERYDGIQLIIESKKLRSGKRQVKFYTKGLSADDYYGYMLVDAEKTLREVIVEIKDRISKMGDIGSFYQRHLFSIRQKENTRKEAFVIFKN